MQSTYLRNGYTFYGVRGIVFGYQKRIFLLFFFLVGLGRHLVSELAFLSAAAARFSFAFAHFATSWRGQGCKRAFTHIAISCAQSEAKIV